MKDLSVYEKELIEEMTRQQEHGASLTAFFLLSLFAWVIWLSQAAYRFGFLPWAPSLSSPLNALTVWSPGLAAIYLTWRADGKSGIRLLFSTITEWRIPIRWYIVALLLPPFVWGVALGIDRLVGQTYELGAALLVSTFTTATAFMVPIAVVFTLPNALGEELGWRAYALPKLQDKYSPLWASVGLGLFWGFWHVPAWIAWADDGISGISLLAMVVNTIPVAILFTWLFNRTEGSLLIVCLYHSVITNVKYFLPKLPTYTESGLLWMVAIIVVVTGGLSPAQKISGRVAQSLHSPDLPGGR